MIFISHNHQDKQFVEPIAQALADAFGEDKVFYDSWAIQPGDSILAKMNKGLAEATFVFVFFTENTLASKMVSLERYSALAQAMQEKPNASVRIIPVRAGDVVMPVLLADRLYINLYRNGMDAALRQMVDVVRGEAEQASSPEAFSNLEAPI